MKTAVTICLISTVAFILTLLVVLPTITQEKEEKERRKATPDSQPITTNFYYPDNNNNDLKSFQKRELFIVSVLCLVPLLSMGGLVAAGAAPLYAYDKYKDWKKRRANAASQLPKPVGLSKADEDSFKARYEKEQNALKDTSPPPAGESAVAPVPADAPTVVAADAPVAASPKPPAANEYSSKQRFRSDEMIRQDDCSLLPWYLQEACNEEKAYFEKEDALLKAQYEAYKREKYYAAYEEYVKQVTAERDKVKEGVAEAVNDKVVKEQQYEEAAGQRRQKINRYLLANGRPELPEDKKSSESGQKSAPKSAKTSASSNHSGDSEERIIQLDKTGSGGEG